MKRALYNCTPSRIRTCDPQLPATLCYHSQPKKQILHTHHNYVCWIIFSKFLLTVVVVWNTSLPYWNSCKIVNLHSLLRNSIKNLCRWFTKPQLRYLLYTLYTFMRYNALTDFTVLSILAIVVHLHRQASQFSTVLSLHIIG